MSQIHYFQRYSSVENTVTNNTLQLLARIYGYSTSRASRLLTELVGEPLEIGVEISQHERGKSSVPDGTIIQRSFKILIESKVDASPTVKQLLKHCEAFSEEDQKILLLLTKELKGDSFSSTIAEKYPEVIFRNITYKEICETIKTLFKDYEDEMSALVDDYVEYCNDAKLFDQSKHLMRIVPCVDSFDINKKYGIYFCPSDRGYTRHRFLGLYTKKVVEVIFEIESIFDVRYKDNQLKKTLIEGRDTNEYDDKLIAIINDAREKCNGLNISSGRRFFCGKPVETKYTKSSPGGIFGPRYVNLRDVIGDFDDVSDVAQKLENKEWE